MPNTITINNQQYTVGSQYWFYNHHIASYLCNSNTFRGILVSIDESLTGIDYIKCCDLLGEEYHLSKYCMSIDDPRKSFDQEEI